MVCTRSESQLGNISHRGTLLARYCAGDCEGVWREIHSYTNLDDALRDEVMAVAEETMRRGARNADLLAERLEAQGWHALSGQLRTKPQASDRLVIGDIERITGHRLPPSLRAFWTIVVGIDFIWDYHSKGTVPDLGVDLPIDEMDPLCVDAPGGYPACLVQEWEEEAASTSDGVELPLHLGLSPDDLTKINVSGGLEYGMALPFHGADPVFAGEYHKLPFVSYLRLAFRWAGFPGLERFADRPDVQQFVATFGEGFEPF